MLSVRNLSADSVGFLRSLFFSTVIGSKMLWRRTQGWGAKSTKHTDWLFLFIFRAHSLAPEFPFKKMHAYRGGMWVSMLLRFGIFVFRCAFGFGIVVTELGCDGARLWLRRSFCQAFAECDIPLSSTQCFR